jgi:hypothetical protein
MPHAHIADRLHEGDDVGEGLFARIVVKASAARRYASFWLDPSRLNENGARTGHGELAQMGQMPLSWHAIDGRILAHGRDDNAIGQRKPTQLEWREQLSGHG